jgi:hypothetical protein
VKLLPAENDDIRLEHARAAVTPSRAARGTGVRLTVEGLRPEADEGPVDLTIYVLHGRGWPLPSAPAHSRRYIVVVEATLRVRAGSAGYTFRTVPRDVAGRYVAVFRRTDCSSRPVARVAFELE